MPLYPDVPRTPGVPPVFRLPGAIETAIVPLLTDAEALIGGQTFQWGVFREDGTPALVPDTVLGVEYRAEYAIPKYPIEDGAFRSYNKVRQPYEARVVMACAGLSGRSVGSTLLDRGSQANRREQFLRDAEALVESLDTFLIITPERTYLNANVTGQNYSRRATEGAQLVIVELHIEEVRVAPAATYSATRAPGSADAVNGGAVQTVLETVP